MTAACHFTSADVYDHFMHYLYNSECIYGAGKDLECVSFSAALVV